MKIATISVQRPVFATVVSLLLVILGLLALTRLPVRELPEVEAPIVSIETTYLGASADVVETKITQVIEDRVSGLEGITKITSQSVDGRSSINLEFDPARSVDDAANDVRDRVARVASNLPPEADPPEIGKVDFNADPIIWVNLSSSTLDVLELTDYAERVIAERLGVLPGVARVRFGGARRYAMRVWIDREAWARNGAAIAARANGLLGDERGAPVRLAPDADFAQKDSDLIACEVECRRDGIDGLFVEIEIPNLAPLIEKARAKAEGCDGCAAHAA